MIRVRAKTEDGKTLSGPSAADDFNGALRETEKAAQAAGKTLTQVFMKVVSGVGPGIKLATPRAAKGSKKK